MRDSLIYCYNLIYRNSVFCWYFKKFYYYFFWQSNIFFCRKPRECQHENIRRDWVLRIGKLVLSEEMPKRVKALIAMEKQHRNLVLVEFYFYVH